MATGFLALACIYSPCTFVYSLWYRDYYNALVTTCCLPICAFAQAHAKARHHHLFSLWIVGSCLAFPIRAFLGWFDVLPELGLWPPVLWAPISGAMLHDSVAPHLVGTFRITALVLASHHFLSDIALTSVTATSLSTLALLHD